MSQSSDQQFNCVIIGSGTLPIHCAEILLSKGHRICAIVSADIQIKKWAKENAIVHFAAPSELTEQLSEPFDYLFSIVNEYILREDVLQLPRRLAINYHDAPLPKYAGTHATSWALLNGETSHGISWHVITETVDAGDILKQRQVDIAENDTALTLNTKCYEAAINAFGELVEDLSTGSVVAARQNLDERTFFPRFKRPANGSIISFNKKAGEISALVRALDFGNHPNPLGASKINIKDEFFIVSELEILNLEAESAPGTINAIGEDFLQVSAADREIAIRKISQLNGQPLSISALTEKFYLRKGFQFTGSDPETIKRIENFYKANSKNESFWVKRLSALEPAVPPYINSAVVTDTAKIVSLSLSIPEKFSEFLKNQLSENERELALLTAFGILLARLNGIDSFDAGYVDTKIESEITGLENLFAGQVPFRFEVDCLQDFRILLETIKDELAAVKNRRTYARDLPARFPQIRPIIASGNDFSLPVAVANVEDLEDFQPASGNELSLVIAKGRAKAVLVYDQNRISAENINRLAEHFTVLLEGIAATECQMAYLPLLTEKELQQVLVDWNETHADYPQDKCIHQLVERQAAKTPEATALIFGEKRLTYHELNYRANQLAHYLQKLGTEAEVLVGIYVERSVEMVISILATLKSGGAYIPLDPNYPKERIDYMLDDSGASVVVTKQHLSDGLNENQTRVVCLDEDSEQIKKESGENPVSAVAPNNLAYVIYTSGSTGKPKGVAIEHRSAVAFLSWANSVFNAEQLKGVLASTSMCFDLSIYEMFAPLGCGGKIILVENVLHLPTAAAALEVTLINTVPSAIAELLRIKGVPKSVRTVNLAGEPLKISLVREIYELENIKEVFDLYGPSEDTTYSTYTLRDTGAATIGRPVTNTQAYILDRFMQPVPTGIAGELYLGGAGLARGYLNRPELTDERFIKNPFREDSSRLYKTGDLVRYLPNSNLEYLGRIDNQVKIRGFRIELGEIEAKLLLHRSIREAVVIARENQTGEKKLIAYLAAQQAIKQNELREYLKQTLPDYMIPSAFVELDELPLTPNGKVDRKALPEPSPILTDSERDFVAHRDTLEEQLTKIWETILEVQPIGVQDNFFELGGHSLQAVRMFAEVEKTFNKNIPLATLFEAGTIEKLAEIIRQDGWAAPESSLVPIQPEGSKPPFFCVHAKGGNVLFYRDLAKHLGTDQPFYGIQARRLGGRQVGHATVQEMADFYISEIQTLQPEGPYYLGGSSFGGLAAFEMARKLHERGEKIALLALFDTGTPDYPKLLPTTNVYRAKIYELVRRFQHHRDSLKAFNAKQRRDYFLDKVKKVKLQVNRKINNTYKKAARKFFVSVKGAGAIPKNYIQVEDQIWKAGLKYVPEVYAGKMILFRALNQPLGIQPDPTLGWNGLAEGGIEIHEVPGHHGSIVAEPYVRVLAEKLNDCLALVRTETNQAAEKLLSDETGKRNFAQTASLQQTV